MSEQAALLREIIEHPDDDMSRLILADWLEDRNAPGDFACSQFIRVQCELARMGLGDPKRPELEAMEKSLAPRHPRRWAKPIRGFIRSWSYDRGLIGGVKITWESLVLNADQLFDAAPVQCLELRVQDGLETALTGLRQARSIRGLVLSQAGGIGRDEVRPLLLNPIFAGLRELTLTDFLLPVAWPISLSNAPWLGCIQKLDLRSVGLPQFPSTAAGTLPEVRVLRIHDVGTVAGWRFPLLRQLDLRCSSGLGRAQNFLAGMKAPALEEVALISLNLTQIEARDLRAILDRLAGKPLCSLSLAGWRLSREVSHTLLTHPVAKHLARLRLGRVDRESVSTLAGGGELGPLRTLHLDGREDDACVALPELFDSDLAQHLEILKLTRLGISSPTLMRLHSSPLRERLRVLDLSDNAMGDEAGQALAEFDSWPRLLCINLRRTGLSVPVLRDLREILGQRLYY